MNQLETTRKEQYGVLFAGKTQKKFNDSDALQNNSEVQISKIQFLYLEDMILAMKVSYRLKNGQIVDSNCFAPTKTDGLQAKELTLEGAEYVSQVLGYKSTHAIEYLKISTSRGNELEVGTQKNFTKLNKF